MPNLVNGVTQAAVEAFSGAPEAEKRKESYIDLIAVLLAFIVTLVILAFIGQLLWTNVVVDLVSFAKPSKSVWQILGLYVFLSLVHP